MELQSLDFETSLKSIGHFVQVVISDHDENKKIKLVDELQKLLEKASSSTGINKGKLECERTELPNEIWTKVMNYLPTNDIFKNFGLVCKRFHSLTSGVKHLSGKIFDEQMGEIVLKIMKHSRGLVALDLVIKDQKYQMKFSETFIKGALNLCQKLKSLRISGDCELKMDVIEILKQFGPNLEHLAFKNVRTTEETFIEISKLNFLKSLSLRSLYVENLSGNDLQIMTEVVQNLQLAPKLESIDFEFHSNDPEITNLYNQLINEKKDTLKKIGLIKASRQYSICHNLHGLHCDSFATINQCSNLEELSGKLHIHEIQNLKAKLKKLLTGRINTLDEFYVFAQLNRINLEHIEIEMNSEGFTYFAQLEFPALRYLMINLEHYTDNQFSLKNEDLDNLLMNSPNLKALRFNRTPVVMSTKSKFEIFENKGIIIGTNVNLQDDLEIAEYFYTNQKDLLLFEKYKTIKTLYWKQFSDFQRYSLMQM